MGKVVHEFQISKYRVLELDEDIITKDHYTKFRIRGKEYEPVPVYDFGNNAIAINSDENFLGENVEFL